LEAVFGHETTHVYISRESQARIEDDFNSTRFSTKALLDLNMPMKDGFEVLDWLRLQPPGLKRISTIVLTASTRPEDVKRAFDWEPTHTS
jgi:CheY-like chemotaxis protein